MVEQQPSPWARPSGDAVGGAGADPSSVGNGPGAVDAQRAAWRIAVAATADSRWARPSDDSAAGVDRLADGRPAFRFGRVRGPAHSDLPAHSDPPVGADPPECAPAALQRALTVVCPPLIFLAGGVAVVASTMTWATVRAYGFVEFPLRGTDGDQHGQLIMVLGLLAMTAGLLIAGRRVEWGRLLAVVIGLLVVVTAVVDIMRVRRGSLLGNTSLDATFMVGPALWLILSSGVLMFVAGLLAPRRTPDSEPTGPACAGGEDDPWRDRPEAPGTDEVTLHPG